MNIETINVKIKLLSPLCHFGDEQCGTMQTARRMKFKVSDDFIDIPVYSGNALRGTLRTIVFQDMLEKIGKDIHGISQNVYYTLFNGGSLKSGGVELLGFKQDLKTCPAIVLLGSSFGNQMTEGKMKVGMVKPICKELNEYNENHSETSIFSGMISETFQVKTDRLKTTTEVVADVMEKAKETMQMKYEMETLSAGTELETQIQLEFASDLEKSCAVYMLELLKQKKHIGGKSSEGYGEIAVEYETDINPDLYADYLKDNGDKINEFIAMLEAILS